MISKTTSSVTLWTPSGDAINLTNLPYQTVIQGWNSEIFAVNLVDGWYGPTGYGIFGSDDEDTAEAFKSDPTCEGVRVAFDPTKSTPRGVWEARSPEDIETLIEDLLFMEFSDGTRVDFMDYASRSLNFAKVFRSNDGTLVLLYGSKWWSFDEGSLSGGVEALSELLGLDFGDDSAWGKIESLSYPIRIEFFC
jgi:hypothetical protein|nr:MAG TPA: hypothetical protein [Caudoviricetes sp.]